MNIKSSEYKLFLVEELKEFFTLLGLLSSNYYFEHIITNPETRKTILDLKNLSASRILIYSPELFIMPENTRGTPQVKIDRFKRQTFFIKIIPHNKINREEYEIYEHFFKNENIVVFYIDKEKNVFMNRLSDYRLKMYKEVIFVNPSAKDDILNFINSLETGLHKDEIIKITNNFKSKISGG